MAKTLGFFTQIELDRVVGYRRRRQRLAERGVLPPGQHVRTFGRDAIIFPEFAAAGLIAEKPTPQDEKLLNRLRSETQRMYKASSFKALVSAVHAVLGSRSDWSLADLAVAAVEEAADALDDWRARISEAERALADDGIVLSIQLGRIEEVLPTAYRVLLADTDERVSVGVNANRADLSVGAWVTHDRIELGARKGELLVPTVAPHMLAGMAAPEEVHNLEADDTLWNDMFQNIDFQPVVVPSVRDTPFDEDQRDASPRRRYRVRANRALYANANTMARSHGPTTAS